MKTWWNKIQRKQALLRQAADAGQGWLFFRACLFAAVAPPLFRLNLSGLGRWLKNRAAPGSGIVPPEQIDAIVECVDAALAFGSPLLRSSCLTRGLTLYYFLRKAGLNLDLCFGAASRQGELIPHPGHCWLLREGEAFLEQSDPSLAFVPIYTLSGPLPGKKAAAREVA